MAETVNKDDFIEIKFTGYNGEQIFDSNIEEDAKKVNPEFKPRKTIVIVGEGMIVPGLDSAFEGKEIGKDYSQISTIFSATEGRTIEKFIIQQKIEKVKELLIYGEKTVSEIAYELNYSSPQYLSNQFKQTTGLRPSEFRNMITTDRSQLDKI